ncbi:chromate transporter [Alkalihalophilus lindianensis]|uniref:Chromate transporter n=1 Tax=Alkalihalophilus lindianensis TaxID=1630542 RepID=A0ABU3XDS8_9BACI|nr:chromate transporter [Alkalihalophilus lindianensis]MDV2685589.1 chromate transporter [Alkalihalophilus lindianensis]
MRNWRLVWEIFITFSKIGPVTFGGGYAMIPLIEREVVIKKKWLQLKEVSEIFAVAESVPGAIAINSATFIGYRVAGVAGAMFAMAGILIPTFFIVLVLGISFLLYKDHPKIEAAFQGIRPAIVALITYAGYKIGKMAVIDKTTFATVGVTVFCLLFFHLHPVLIIVIGGIAGIALVKIRDYLGYNTSLETHKDETDRDYYRGSGI